MIHNSKFFDDFGYFLKKYPDTDLTDIFSKGQVRSKRWLVNTLIELNEPLGTVFICAGWYASLASFLLESRLSITKIRSFDINTECADKADTLNRSWVDNSWKFKAITGDIHDIDYNSHTWQAWSKVNNRYSKPITDQPDTIINTSCEHIDNFTEWFTKIPFGKLVVLQSNNYYEIQDHINCVNSVEEFLKAAPVSTVLYTGELELQHYTRYMIIGYK